MGVTKSFDGWTPIRLTATDIGLEVDWCYTAGADFGDPFFDLSVQRCLAAPGRLLFRRRTGVDSVGSAAAAASRRPDGLVLHMSRCGSTLVARMLTARGDTLALSEPPVVDTAVRAVAAGAADVSAVTDVLGVLGRLTGDRRYVVKCDAWTVLDAPVLEAALPTTPWVFVHRDPVEVLVSQLASRGYHMVPGTLPPATLGLAAEVLQRLSPVEYCAVVLGRIVEAALVAVRRAGDRALLIDHADLPSAGLRVAAHFGLSDEPAVSERMLSVVDAHAKNPVLPYVDDRDRKQREASPDLRAAVDTWVRPAYDALLEAGRVAA
ncbi:MAG: sulfotransferase family protein [Actinomycetes bacterium]